MRWLAILLFAGCSAPHQAPRFVRVPGGGVQIVETRGDRARTSNDVWLPVSGLEAFPEPQSLAVAPPRTVVLPDGVTTERWIDVEIAAQRLTAYEGKRAVRSFRVSTGVGPEGQMYSTPRGTHHIYAKLRSTTMASAPGEAHPYRFEAVPDVQYFDREVALHGAYWHRRFGERVSHGCVNLAPPDAAWLFEFTTPHLRDSERERAATDRTGKQGTTVRVQ